MGAMQQHHIQFSNLDPVDIQSSLSQLILNGGASTFDSVFSFCDPMSEIGIGLKPESTGSSVYLRQQEILQKFSEETQLRNTRAGAKTTSATPKFQGGGFEKKLYRGVRQRRWRIWVAGIRLPQNRTRVWLGTYDSAEAAAYAYDRAAYKLRGEYARLNFPNLKDREPSKLSFGNSAKLNALKASVDGKIQAICQKMRREKARNSKGSRKTDSSSSSKPPSWPSQFEESGRAVSEDKMRTFASSLCWAAPSADSPIGFLEESESEVYSLEKIPSFDPELIWEILAN